MKHNQAGYDCRKKALMCFQLIENTLVPFSAIMPSLVVFQYILCVFVCMCFVMLHQSDL